MKVEDLINELRNEVGQTQVDADSDESIQYKTEQPEWFNEDNIVETIDIREMLNAGEQPVHEVLSAIKKLNEREILKVIAPFIPAPLIDKSLSMDYKHWLNQKAEEEFWVFFIK